MKPIKVAEPEQAVIEVTDPILSGWLTYKGDQRAGFVAVDDQGVPRERIVGEPNRTRERGMIIDGLWDGRLWVPHEAEVIGTGDTIKTRVRFRQMWTRDQRAVIDWQPGQPVKGADHG
jgi:hypothetical protein